jgi:hypothetical protein
MSGCCEEACPGDACQVCANNKCGLSTAPACTATACGPDGVANCMRAGGTCDRRPGQMELCRWASAGAAECGNGTTFQIITRDSHYGTWTLFASPFALANPGAVAAPPGACITQVINLCSTASFDKCRAYGATSCEKLGPPIYRYDLCRWRNVGEAQCGTVAAIGPPPLNNRGIWTTKDSSFAMNSPGAVQEGDGACITQVTNLP